MANKQTVEKRTMKKRVGKKRSGFGEFVRKLREDKDFRTLVGLYGGAVFNLIFVGIELYGGIRYQLAWFIALAVYYGVLTFLKFYIGLSTRKRGTEREWRVLRTSGLVMIVMNLAMATMISVMIAEPSITLHAYSKVVAIAMAAWTFYLLISAMVSLKRTKGKGDAWLLASRMIRLISAVVAMLMLQTAMIASFGTGSGEDLLGDVVDVTGEVVEVAGGAVDKIGEAVNLPEGVIDLNFDKEVVMSDETMNFLAGANRATGVAVGLLILGLTIYMIVRGTREERRPRLESRKVEKTGMRRRLERNKIFARQKTNMV